MNIEQKILKQNVGSQDQTACTYGGFNHIKFSKKNIKINKIISNNAISEIENSIILIFTRERKRRNFEKKEFKLNFLDKATNIHLREINKITIQALKLINSSFEINEFGKLINEYWKIKKTLNKHTTNSEIDYIDNYCKNIGCYGGKLLGAGGGGFYLVLANNEVKKIKRKFKKFLEIKFEKLGTQIINL